MSDSQIIRRLHEIARNMRGQSEARMEDTSVEAKGFLCEAMDQYADQVELEAANLKALFDAEVAGTHAFDMIAAIEMGNVEITETLIHMVAATVLAKLIEEEGGGRSNITFSPADMDAMHRDYEMQTKRDGLVTTITLVPRDHMTHAVNNRLLTPMEAGEKIASLLAQPEDTTDALPQVEKSVAKPYFFYRDGGGRKGPMSKDEAQDLVFKSVDPTAHVENRMCGNVECPNSDMQGACTTCHPV